MLFTTLNLDVRWSKQCISESVVSEIGVSIMIKGCYSIKDVVENHGTLTSLGLHIYSKSRNFYCLLPIVLVQKYSVVLGVCILSVS